LKQKRYNKGQMKLRLSEARLRHWLGLSLLSFFVAVGLMAGSMALADSIVRSFSSQGKLQPGWIVALGDSSSTTVKAAPANNPSEIYGVVINSASADISISHTGQNVYVATSGNYPVLVSAAQGKIAKGDYISMSDIDGIGGKADSQVEVVVGRATTGFDGQKNVLTSVNGEAIGQVTVSVDPGHNPILKNVSIPGPLQKVGNAIAGREISPARIYGALGIFGLGAILTSGILFVGIRSGITAIGRNPLSRRSILQGLFQVVGVAVMVFVLDLVGVYLLLRL